MTVTVGKKVPAFSVPATGGKSLGLKDFKGKRLVLYFYPKDSTPGCTTEGQDFRDHYKQFLKANCDILGVSQDSLKLSRQLQGQARVSVRAAQRRGWHPVRAVRRDQA